VTRIRSYTDCSRRVLEPGEQVERLGASPISENPDPGRCHICFRVCKHHASSRARSRHFTRRSLHRNPPSTCVRRTVVGHLTVGDRNDDPSSSHALVQARRYGGAVRPHRSPRDLYHHRARERPPKSVECGVFTRCAKSAAFHVDGEAQLLGLRCTRKRCLVDDSCRAILGAGV
jgi:hypothetical protein